MSKIDLGQVFTPAVIADYMINMFTLDENKSTILDPCFGEGIFINRLNKLTDFKVEGVELDKKLFNKLVSELEKSDKIRLHNCDFIRFEPKKKYSGIIMNPPYIRHEKIDDLLDFGINKELIHSNKIFKNLSKHSNMYMYFIIKGLHLLEENGELIVIFPGTWKKSKTSYGFRKELERLAVIEEEVDLKGEVFGKNVLVDVIILKLVRRSLNEGEESFYSNPKLSTMEYRGIKLSAIEDNNNSLECFKHVSLSDYSDNRRGITTGHNKFFINDFSYSSSFISVTKNIISSPKAITGYSTKNAATESILILDKDESQYDIAVKNYIEKGKEEIIFKRKPKALLNQIERDARWYQIRPLNSKGIIFSYIIRKRMKFVMNDSDCLIRDNFYILNPKINKYLLFALLNNLYTFSRLEDIGKQYGAGILKLQKYDLDHLKVIDIDSIKKEDCEKMIALSKELIKTGDENIIFKITKLISIYESITFEEIKDRYYLQQKNRLLKGAK